MNPDRTRGRPKGAKDKRPRKPGSGRRPLPEGERKAVMVWCRMRMPDVAALDEAMPELERSVKVRRAVLDWLAKIPRGA